jgi:hypothetical protein
VGTAFGTLPFGLPQHHGHGSWLVCEMALSVTSLLIDRVHKVETPIHDSIRELVTWECKEHGVES